MVTPCHMPMHDTNLSLIHANPSFEISKILKAWPLPFTLLIHGRFGDGTETMGKWEGMAMEFSPGPPCPTLVHPAGGPPLLLLLLLLSPGRKFLGLIATVQVLFQG
jgi:hypothetical protein